MTLKLTSPAFAEGAEIPASFTCDGANSSPALAWSGAPAGTRSFLLTCNDPDAPAGVWHHWAAFDIPADWSGLEAGFGAERPAAGFREAVNDFGKPGYGGPCPPRGHGPHHYHFRLSALGEASLPAASSASCVEVMHLARPYVLEFTELVGLYERGN